MSAAPFMQFYVADYLGDTQHLTTEQHGAYLLLLMAMWRSEGKLPNDTGKLARIARVGLRRWHIVAKEVMPFFEVDGDFITQKRLVEEHKKAVSISEKRSASGKLGGRAKSLKNNDTDEANAKQMYKHSQISEPEATLSSVAKVPPAKSPPENDLDELQNKLIDAAGENGIHPHGTFFVGEISQLIAVGVSLEIDILPIIRSRCARLNRPVRSWSYFVPAIKEAYQRRVSAGKHLPAPTPFDDSEERWIRRLRVSRHTKDWCTEINGPMPGSAGCRVPPHLLVEGDGVDWKNVDRNGVAA